MYNRYWPQAVIVGIGLLIALGYGIMKGALYLFQGFINLFQ